MTGDSNNIFSNITPSSSTLSSVAAMFGGLGPEQMNTLLLCDPSFASLFGALLPSSLHAAGAAAVNTVGEGGGQQVIVSGAPLTAPPSIDNCGGSEDSTVDYRRNEALYGASAVPPSVSQQQRQLQQREEEEGEEIVILGEERRDRTHTLQGNYVSHSTPLRPPSFSSFRSDSPTGCGGVSSPAAAVPPPAGGVGGVGEAVNSAQTMLIGGIAGLDLPLLVPITAGGGAIFNDLRLPATPDSPQNTFFSTATSSGVSSGASSTSSAARSAAAKMATTLKDALISNGEMMPKQEPLSHEGSEVGLDLNGRPPVPLCAICSADSTGIHFGVEACAACSAFFRRTVVLNKNYECTKGGECITHKDTGGSARCRACRFKKCITVGMDRGAVQHRRDAIGKVSQIKKEEQGSPMMEDEMTTMMNAHHSTSYHHLMMPSTSQPVQPQKTILDEWVERHMKLSKKRKLFYTLSNLTEAFEDRKELVPAPSEMRNFSECMYQLWRIEPRLIANYVNDNAHLSHIRPHEKAALFRNFFMAFQAVEEPYLTWQFGGLAKEWWVMPNRMYFCFDHINEYFATNIMSGLNLDMATAIRIFIPSFHHAIDVVARPMADLGISYVEMVALSAVVYLDPMTPGICEETRNYLHKARGELIATLLRYYHEILFKQRDLPDTPEIRLSQLLNISAGVKIHAERTRENMQILSLFDVIPCDNLFNEMCNIQTAYNDKARSKLRERAINEELVPPSMIEAADVKWSEYKRQVECGMLERGTPINKMHGSKTNTYMGAPVLERDVHSQMQQQLAMIKAQKKEEPEEEKYTPMIPSIPAVAAVVAPSPSSRPARPTVGPTNQLIAQKRFLQQQVAAAAASTAPPTVSSSTASSMSFPHSAFTRHQAPLPPVIPLSSSISSSSSNHNHNHNHNLHHHNRALATVAMSSHQPLATASMSSVNLNSEQVIANILAKQPVVEQLQGMLGRETDQRFFFPGMESDQWVSLAGMIQAAESTVSAKAATDAANAATVAAIAEMQMRHQNCTAGPSSEKRARLSVADTGSDPMSPPSNSAMIAALISHQQQQQAQQQQSVVVPYTTLLQQLSMTTQMLQNTPFLMNSQIASQAAVASVPTPVSMTTPLQQNIQQQQQQPF